MGRRKRSNFEIRRQHQRRLLQVGSVLLSYWRSFCKYMDGILQSFRAALVILNVMNKEIRCYGNPRVANGLVGLMAIGFSLWWIVRLCRVA
jgi:hypothetical protein